MNRPRRRETLRARQARPLDAAGLQRLTDGQVALWQRIGQGTLVDDLFAGDERTILEDLRQLQVMGAIEFEGKHVTQESAKSDADPFDKPLSDRDLALLQEENGLSEKERLQLLRYHNAMVSGEFSELVANLPSLNKEGLARAYDELLVIFQPSRFQNRNLGSFGLLIDEIRSIAKQARDIVLDPRTVLLNQRRRPRNSPRWALATHVTMSSGSLPDDCKVMTQDVSTSGVFLVTDDPVPIGEHIEMKFDSFEQALTLHGFVVTRRAPEIADRLGLYPGLGVRFHASANDDRVNALLAAAQVTVPAVALPGDNVPTRSRHVARGTLHHRQEVVGIDFGVSNISVAVAIGNAVHVLETPDSRTSWPSAVALPRPGQVLTGDDAVRHLQEFPEHGVQHPKLFLGRTIDDPWVQRWRQSQPMAPMIPGPNGRVAFDIHDESYAPAQLCGYALQGARTKAQQALKRGVAHVVLTSATHFGEADNELLVRAAEMTQLHVAEIVPEPRAVALAHRHLLETSGLVGVYDLGGHCFDFSILEASAGEFNIIAAAGNSLLGGDQLDLDIAHSVSDEFLRTQGIELRQGSFWPALLTASEHAKRQLSLEEATTIVLPKVVQSSRGDFDLKVELSRRAVARAWRETLQQTLAVFRQATTIAGVRETQLSTILVSGGAAQSPMVIEHLQSHCQVPVLSLRNPQFHGAVGAALCGASAAGRLA